MNITLTRKAYPQARTRRIAEFTLNGHKAYSADGYHAELELPNYKYLDKISRRPAGNINLEPAAKVTLGEFDLDNNTVELSSGARLDADFVLYYRNRYPTAEWQQELGSCWNPVQLRIKNKLVAVIMPLGN